MGRPSVSVVVPFAGDRRAAEQVIAAFRPLALGPGDEVVVGDNSPGGVFGGLDLPPHWSAVAAEREGSPAHARNAGAAAAAGDLLLFVDSDCVPAPDLVDRHVDFAAGDDAGVIAGRIVARAGQTSAAARYAATREHLDQQIGLTGDWPWAHSANLLVRREVWDALGGFLEGIRVAEDVDLCWRARRAGHRLAYNPDAVVEHEHRDTFGALWRQAVVAGASAHWVHRRWPDAPRPRSRAAAALARAAAAIPFFLLTARPRRALFKLWDAALALAPIAGWFRANRAGPRPQPEPAAELWTETWPDDAPLPAEPVRVVAARRAERFAPVAPAAGVVYLEDFTPLERARALARLTLRHPLRVLRDRGERPLRELAPAAHGRLPVTGAGAEAERVRRLR